MLAFPGAISPLRQRLASFEHAYAVALRRRVATGELQWIVRTGDPLQPYRVIARGAAVAGEVLAQVA